MDIACYAYLGNAMKLVWTCSLVFAFGCGGQSESPKHSGAGAGGSAGGGSGTGGQAGIAGTSEPTVFRNSTLAWGTKVFESISAGQALACGLDQSKQVTCWGDTPTQLTGTFDTISVGGLYVCGLRSNDSRMVCAASLFQGRDPNPMAQLPAQVDEVTTPQRAISAWDTELSAVDNSGNYGCWGIACDTARPPLPTAEYSELSAGDHKICGLDSAGQVTCVAQSYASASVTETTQPSERVAEVAVMRSMSESAWGILPNGTLAAWKLRVMDQEPPVIPSGTFNGLSCGGGTCCALMPNNDALCWSSGGVLQTISGPFKQVAVGGAGGEFACFLDLSGRAGCLGTDVDYAPFPTPP